jgi:hypothetical protein
MNKAPDRIWLHRRDPEDGFGVESTWSEDQIEDWDVEYVRADAPAVPDPRDAEIADLRAQLEAEQASGMMLRREIAKHKDNCGKLKDENQALTNSLRRHEESGPTTLAEHKTPRSRAQRINDLAAGYAGDLMSTADCGDESDACIAAAVRLSVHIARALATAVVEAEE